MLLPTQPALPLNAIGERCSGIRSWGGILVAWRTTMADSGAEEMDGELELLNAMFEDTGSLSISPTDACSGVAVEVRVVLQPAVDARVTTTLVAQLPVGYPRHARPVVSFVSSRGLADSDVKNLHSSAAEQVAESVEDGGTTCVFQIVEAVRGVLDEVNYSEASHQCAICLDELATTDSYTSTCFHTFHRACMGHWVAELHAKRSKSAASQRGEAVVNARVSHVRGEVTNKQALIERLEVRHPFYSRASAGCC